MNKYVAIAAAGIATTAVVTLGVALHKKHRQRRQAEADVEPLQLTVTDAQPSAETAHADAEDLDAKIKEALDRAEAA